MKLVYATDFDSKNIHNWSGLGVYYGKMLDQAGFDMSRLSDLSLPNPLFHFLKKHYTKRIWEKTYSPRFNTSVSQNYAKIIHKEVKPGTPILSPNTVILAHLNKNLKTILYADATLEALLKFYPEYSRFTKACLADGKQIDQQAIDNSNLLIYTSKWAANSAINDYNADPSKIFIVPFGANLDYTPSTEEVSQIIKKRDINSHVNLLFLGVDWERKGGQYALNVTETLNRSGIPATLHIAGIKHLPSNLNKQHIINHGYISKATAAGQKELSAVIADSNFLILPSLADCTPVSFSEANAFGVPCLVSNVGGHVSIIENGVNGMVSQHVDFVENSVKYITELRESNNAYQRLCFDSYERYRTELNWKTSGEKISKLIESI
ncbi:MAG: glycosyltransferase family 4 protein [Ginsengibacter sp.]